METLPLSYPELLRRTWREVVEDDVLGLAAQLSYYLFLALFPAILFLLALASFFPLSNVTDDVGRSLGPFVSPQVLQLIQEQMRRLADNENGGLLTFGVAGALWSSSSALVSIAGALNRAYDIEEGRPWWKVRLVSIALTLTVAAIVLVALSLVLLGPTLAETLGRATGLGAPFEWTWLVLQWPLVFALVASAIGLVYYFGPDAEQDWSWITPGAITATILWLVVSLLFKLYIANFTDYEGSYGTAGGVMVVLLWFYVSGIAVLVGAELNAEIEHASPYGKAPGQKNAQGKRLLGARASRAFEQQQQHAEVEREQREIAVRRSAPVPLPRTEPGVRELLGGLSADVRSLASQTATLARLELSKAAADVARSMAGVAAGVVLSVAGLAVLVGALVLILIAVGLPPWAAALIVGSVLIVGGGLLAVVFGSALRDADFELKETRASVRETLHWLTSRRAARQS